MKSFFQQLLSLNYVVQTSFDHIWTVGFATAWSGVVFTVQTGTQVITT